MFLLPKLKVELIPIPMFFHHLRRLLRLKPGWLRPFTKTFLLGVLIYGGVLDKVIGRRLEGKPTQGYLWAYPGHDHSQLFHCEPPFSFLITTFLLVPFFFVFL